MPHRSVVAVGLVVALLSCPLLLLRARAADHAAPPAGVATSYPAFDLHPAEQVAIAADPYNTQEKASIFRFKYLDYGFMPIRIIVTNNGDKPISLIDCAHQLHYCRGRQDTGSQPEEVQRRIGGIKRPDGGYKLPGPLPRIGNKSSTKNKDVDEDFHSFEYSAVAVEAHTTRAGFFLRCPRARQSAGREQSSTCACCVIPRARSSSTSRFPSTSTWPPRLRTK